MSARTLLESRYQLPAHHRVEISNVSLSEIISALSFALDLVEDAAPGHAVRTCFMGMKIAEELDLGCEDRRALYYALLLKDAGCSSNAGRIYAITGGDDRRIKCEMKRQDWTRITPATLRMLWSHVLLEAGPFNRAFRIARIGFHWRSNVEEVIRLRSDRGRAHRLEDGIGRASGRGRSPSR